MFMQANFGPLLPNLHLHISLTMGLLYRQNLRHPHPEKTIVKKVIYKGTTLKRMAMGLEVQLIQ